MMTKIKPHLSASCFRSPFRSVASVNVEFAHVRGAHGQSCLNADDRAVRVTADVIYWIEREGEGERERESKRAWERKGTEVAEMESKGLSGESSVSVWRSEWVSASNCIGKQMRREAGTGVQTTVLMMEWRRVAANWIVFTSSSLAYLPASP